MKLKTYIKEEEKNVYLLTENLSQAWVEKQFMHWTREIWGERAWDNLLKGRISFTNLRGDYKSVTAKSKKTSDPIMALIHSAPGGKAISQTLFRVAKWYKVYISARMLQLKDKVKALKIIKHEVIHIGYGKHDSNFRDMCKTWGAGQTESHADDGGFELQIRIKPRKWITIEMFDDHDEAMGAGKALARNHAEQERLKKEHKVQDEHIRISVKG